jgi:hypothetical protein
MVGVGTRQRHRQLTAVASPTKLTDANDAAGGQHHPPRAARSRGARGGCALLLYPLAGLAAIEYRVLNTAAAPSFTLLA